MKKVSVDLKKDSYERHDIADKHPELIAELEAEYKKWDAKNIAPGWLDPHIPNCIKGQKRWEAERKKSTFKTANKNSHRSKNNHQ